MSVPASYDVTILVNDVDVTQYVPYDSMALDDYARQVSTFKMTIENPSGVTPTRQHTVKVTWNFDDSVIFIGYIMELTTRKRDNGITKIYECDCADRKILLQRTVIGGNEFTGSDLDILGDLLTNAYPDLSTLFDFATDVTSFADGLDFPIEDGTNLLDALNDLADLADADYRFENPTLAGEYNVNFEAGGDAYTDSSTASTSVTTGGNPDNCIKTTDLNDEIIIEIDLGSVVAVSEISVDAYIQGDGLGGIFFIQTDADTPGGFDEGYAADYNMISHSGAGWQTYLASTLPDDNVFTFPVNTRYIYVYFSDTAGPSTLDRRLDNIVITLDGGGTDTNNLQWNSAPDAADFDIDVQAGGEYASDIDLSIGSLDDFNSVTVIGGYEEVAIEKALDSDGVRDHIALPYPVKSLAVYKNTGTDTTPVWGSALALGAWGSDTLISGGGSKDVLLDSVHNVLFFNTAPSNLVNSYKITGTIERPIRVRVESVAAGDLTLATSHTDETITSVDQAVAIGSALLEQKNSIRQLSFNTLHPGLKPGQSIPVTDSARGLAETTTIRRISTKWLGSSGHAVFDVECGDDDSTGIDAMVANADRRARSNGAVTSPNTQTAYILTSDGVPLSSDGNPIYSLG